MSSKQEIKNLFIEEIKNSVEYGIILQVKQFILNEIATPNIKEHVVYNFETPLNQDQRNNIKLSMLLEFGFYTEDLNMNDNCIIIDMKQFLL